MPLEFPPDPNSGSEFQDQIDELFSAYSKKVSDLAAQAIQVNTELTAMIEKLHQDVDIEMGEILNDYSTQLDKNSQDNPRDHALVIQLNTSVLRLFTGRVETLLTNFEDQINNLKKK